MNYGSVLADVYRRLNLPSAPASATTTRLAAFLNEAVQEVLSEPGLATWIARHEPPITFASVASQAVYAIPGSLQRIDAITERATLRKLAPRDLQWLRTVQPDPTNQTGTPSIWVPLGWTAAAVQPSAAAELFVKSDSASDGATKTAYVEGYVTGGYYRSASVALNGVTAASFGATITTWIEIQKFYIQLTTGGATTAAGNVTINQTSGAGAELSRIPIGQSFARYQSLALWPTPASAITYYVDGERDLPDMSNTADESPLPPRLHELLIDGVLVREYEKLDDTRYAAAKARFTRRLSQLKYFVTCPPDFLPSRGTREPEWNRLGGNYPNGAGIR